MKTVTTIHGKPDDVVSFVVLCRPKSGSSWEDVQKNLSLEQLGKYLPDDPGRTLVIKGLEQHGFTVYANDPSPMISASGPVSQFENVFSTKLQAFRHKSGRKSAAQRNFCAIDPKAAPANVQALPGAIRIIPLEPPVPCGTTAIPPASTGFHLRHPVDIAMATRAALVHRQGLPTGHPATGVGVRVAIIDSGFFPHGFYERNGYNIQAERAADVTDPATQDDVGHGTKNAVNIFSCAPDADVIGVKAGGNFLLAFDRAAALSAKVISLSYVFDLDGKTTLDDTCVAWRLALLNLLSQGITLVCSAGNMGQIGFPGMMPEVISVGGVAVDAQEGIQAWDQGSSFVSAIFADRAVPDLCGVASEMALPLPPDSDPAGDNWDLSSGATSAAAPQVAGVIALLLQKNPTLSPQAIKTILCDSARDVIKGSSFMKEKAKAGKDRATGAGLVDAFNAWQHV